MSIYHTIHKFDCILQQLTPPLHHRPQWSPCCLHPRQLPLPHHHHHHPQSQETTLQTKHCVPKSVCTCTYNNYEVQIIIIITTYIIVCYTTSLIPRPLPRFQCNIENVGVAWGRGYYTTLEGQVFIL